MTRNRPPRRLRGDAFRLALTPATSAISIIGASPAIGWGPIYSDHEGIAQTAARAVPLLCGRVSRRAGADLRAVYVVSFATLRRKHGNPRLLRAGVGASAGHRSRSQAQINVQPDVQVSVA